jgi:hypothetical protein
MKVKTFFVGVVEYPFPVILGRCGAVVLRVGCRYTKSVPDRLWAICEGRLVFLIDVPSSIPFGSPFPSIPDGDGSSIPFAGGRS